MMQEKLTFVDICDAASEAYEQAWNAKEWALAQSIKDSKQVPRAFANVAATATMVELPGGITVSGDVDGETLGLLVQAISLGGATLEKDAQRAHFSLVCYMQALEYHPWNRSQSASTSL